MSASTTTHHEGSSTVCRTTGLPVISRPEWTDCKFGSGYRLTTWVIGDRILFNQGSGTAELEDIVDSLRMTDAIVREHIDDSNGYVHVSDYSGMRGITSEARKYYIGHKQRQNKLLGLIYFGASPLFNITVKLFKRLSRINLKVRAVRDYDEALLAALRLIGAEPPKAFPDGTQGRLREKQVSDHYEQGRHILRCDRWNLLLDDYS
ncbi:MAG: hypothetical protein WBY88_00100, partial [Desulfosarcina sp.]